MAEITDLEIVDASNTARMPENQAPSSVNNGVRALEGILARGFQDALEGDKDSTGSANAYVVAANRTISAYYDGMRQGFHASFANTSSATLNIDSVGAKALVKNHNLALVGQEIEQHQYVDTVYSASNDAFHILSPLAITTNSIQPAFLAYNSADDVDVTGNGTTATVDFDTEVYDQGGDFAADTFTAPVTARYLLTTNVLFFGLTAAADSVVFRIITSNRNYQLQTINTNDLPSTMSLALSIVADMDAADTATVTLVVNGEASDVVDIDGDASANTSFSGALLT